MIIETDKLIIGGGPAGLFIAKEFLRRSTEDFLLLENHSSSLGGLASQGWMKIGLFPAGRSTAETLGMASYLKFSECFIDDYRSFLSEVENSESINPSANFERKYYKSLLLSNTDFRKIIEQIKQTIQSNLIYNTAKNISKYGLN